jgi:class 3 adenylate cyclase
VALVVFDAHSEVDPFAGVKYWMRALKQAEEAAGLTLPRIKKILVQARIDRGGVSVSLPRLKKFATEQGFDGFYNTSAKERTGIEPLKAAIKKAIDWDTLPRVSSTELFQKITDFLMEEKGEGRILSTAEDLYRTYIKSKGAEEEDEKLPAQFKTCIRLMGVRGLIRRLSFGNLVLLQPELLDAYASAMVNAAKDEPDGLGSIPEAEAREGLFVMPLSERIKDVEQEKLLLIATVEDLLSHEIALREHTDDGTHLVFPTELTRRNPSLPDPEGKTVAFTFGGAVRNIYATLAVRLSHSGLFKKKEMWKNAAAYEATVGGTCGMFIREIDEGFGELTLFFDDKASEQTRFQFEEYVYAHLMRKVSYNSLERHRILTCEACGFFVTRQLIRIRAERQLDWINCPGCQSPTPNRISLVDSDKRRFGPIPQFVPVMDRAADTQRDFDTGLTSAVGQMRSRGFGEWAGSKEATVAIVFTDIVGSTALANELGNEAMDSVRRSHFEAARRLEEKYDCYEIKTIGDSFMVAFRTAVQALDFAISLYTNTGSRRVSIRAGIHVGPLRIEEHDGFGLMVNYTARIVAQPDGAEIWVSDTAKNHIDDEKAHRHKKLVWIKKENKELKGFEGKHTLWSLERESIFVSQEESI